MRRRIQRFFGLLRQYTIGESLLLVLLTALRTVAVRIPSYLVRTRTSFDRYYHAGYTLERSGRDTLVARNGMTVSLRRDSSDLHVFDQIFLEEEFRPLVALIKANNIKVNRVLDCGANIGLTSLYLLNAFSDCRILALEPEPANFDQLQKNIQLNKVSSIVPVKQGVWSRKALMEHDNNFCHAKGWAFAVREAEPGSGSIAVDTIDNITEAYNFSNVDYIKMDIEGSEFELFRNIDTWQKTLASAKIISVEVHEKKGSVTEIEQCLTDLDFKIERFGELLVGYRK